MKIYTKDQILSVLHIPEILEALEKGFIHYSEKQFLASPVGYLGFQSPPGDVHIKAGGIIGDEYYVIKMASAFYENPKIGLSSMQGLMLLFSQKTGKPEALLLDEGRLTDLRTGLAGAICAKYLAPNPIHSIGIIGTGGQAKEQLLCLQHVTLCRKVVVWGRNPAKALAFSQDPALSQFSITCAPNIQAVTQQCNLIVTTTPSMQPLLYGEQIRPGTHITAVGADTEDKQELDRSVFAAADLIVVDSLSQCLQHGDSSHAKEILANKTPIELGTLLKQPIPRDPFWITVSDLTGIAVQDLQIAMHVLRRLL